MNFPSHATSSVNQVAEMYSGNPQALQQRTQPQNGVTPELIDLLALQKVQAEKKAAADQLSMQQGQAQPTVAQDMHTQAIQSARQEIMQKLGLPGFANQGQNVPQGTGTPQQAGPTPAPAAPPQGLPGIPSNLPEGYAGGGIVSFDEGGAADDMSADSVPQVSDGVDTMAAIRKLLRALAHDDDSSTPAPTPSGATGSGATGSWAAPSTYAQHQGAGYTADPSTVAAPDPSSAAAPTPPAAAQQNPPPAAQSARVSTSSRSPSSGGLAGITRDNPEAAGDADLKRMLLDSYKKTIDPDLHDIMDKAVADPRYQQVATDRAAGIEDQKQGLAKLQALQAQGVANRPSDFTRALQLMGNNLHSVGGMGAAFAGVSSGMDATHAAYNNEDISNQTTINGLYKAMNDARASGDMETYNVAHSAMTSAVAQSEKSQTNATAMADINTRSRGMMLAHALAAQESGRHAMEEAQRRGDSKSLGVLGAEQAKAEAEGTRRAQAEAAITAKTDPLGEHPVNVQQNALVYKQQLLDNNQVYQNEFKKYYGVTPTPMQVPPPAPASGTTTGTTKSGVKYTVSG